MWCCGIYGSCNVFWASRDTEKTVESSTTNIKDTLDPATLCLGCLDDEFVFIEFHDSNHGANTKQNECYGGKFITL